MGLSDIQETIGGIGEDVVEFISEKPITSASIGVGVLGATGIIMAVAKGGKTKTTRKRKTSKRTKKGRSRDRKFISKQKHERAYVKRKKKAGKKITRPRYKTKSNKKTKKKVGKIYYTKKGQPYKIMASGKAKFIKGKRR